MTQPGEIVLPNLIRPDGTTIHYQIDGAGPPLLALAPGGISSSTNRWAEAQGGPLASYAETFTVISMDQRHAGSSRTALAPFSYDDLLGDQLAVLNAANVQRAHVLASGHACTYALRLAYEAPARVSALTLLRPAGVGTSDGPGPHYQLFNPTIRTVRADGLEGVIDAAKRNPVFIDNPAAGPWCQRLHDEPLFRDTLRSLTRERYVTLVVDFRDGFVPPGRRLFSINDVSVARISAPMLILQGNDARHPRDVTDSLLADARNGRALNLDNAEPTAQIRDFFESVVL